MPVIHATASPTLLPRIRFNWCRYEFFAGVQGHTGPLNNIAINNQNGSDQIGSGSFGFYEGFNRGKSMNQLLGLDISTQIGVRGTQNNLSGAAFTTATRHQVFVTAGFFSPRRLRSAIRTRTRLHESRLVLPKQFTAITRRAELAGTRVRHLWIPIHGGCTRRDNLGDHH